MVRWICILYVDLATPKCDFIFRIMRRHGIRRNVGFHLQDTYGTLNQSGRRILTAASNCVVRYALPEVFFL